MIADGKVPWMISMPGKAKEGAGAATGGLKCRNYGCNQTFTEEENNPTACRHHTAPPVFHDTKKGWACCPKRVYDWDEFNTVSSLSPLY